MRPANTFGQTRPDQKMGVRRRVRTWFGDIVPTSAQNTVEKRRAAKKRRQRDRQDPYDPR